MMRGMQSSLCELSSSSSPYFADLIIGEATGPPLPDRPFL